MSAQWQAVSKGYLLKSPELAGKLVIRGTAPGLRDLSPPRGGGIRWLGPLLAVEAVQAAGQGPFRVSSGSTRPLSRLRGKLVDVQLEASKKCPARIHLYWRVTSSRQIDLEVLASTVEPFETLEVLTLSQVPCGEAPHTELLLLVGHPGRWVDVQEAGRMGAEWLLVPRDHAAATFSLDGRSPRFGEIAIATPFRHPLVLYRPDHHPWSYLEMSHPEDCARVMARVHRGTVQWRFGLFGLNLEKGVILHGRVRGVYIPRRQDVQRAEQLYRRFLAESPRLSV